MADSLDPDPHGTRGSTVHHALDYRAKGEAGLNFAGFRKWCTAPKDEVRLRVLDWLKVLGDLWLQRMALAMHKDDSADGPSRHHHGGACRHKHPGRAHPAHPQATPGAPRTLPQGSSYLVAGIYRIVRWREVKLLLRYQSPAPAAHGALSLQMILSYHPRFYL